MTEFTDQAGKETVNARTQESAHTQGSTDTHSPEVWLGSRSSRPARFSLCCAFGVSTEHSQVGRPFEEMSAGLRPGSAGKLYSKCDRSGHRIRAEEEVRSVAVIHLLQRASHRKHRGQRFRRADS